MQQIGHFLANVSVIEPARSERAYYISKLAALTAMRSRVMFGKTLRLPTATIKQLYYDATTAATEEGKRKKFWSLLKETPCKNKKEALLSCLPQQ